MIWRTSGQNSANALVPIRPNTPNPMRAPTSPKLRSLSGRQVLAITLLLGMAMKRA